MTDLSQYEIIFPLDIKGISSLRQTATTQNGLQIPIYQDFYMIYIPERNIIGRLRLVKDSPKDEFKHLLERGANQVIYASLKETHPRDFVTWGSFESHPIPPELSSLFKLSVESSLILQRLNFSQVGLAAEDEVSRSFRFRDNRNDVEYGFRVSIGSALVEVNSEQIRDADKRVKNIMGQNLTLISFIASFIEYLPSGNYIRRDIKLHTDLTDFHKIIAALSVQDKVMVRCVMLTTSNSYWGTHKMSDLNLILSLNEFAVDEVLSLLQVSLPVLSQCKTTDGRIMKKKSLETFFGIKVGADRSVNLSNQDMRKLYYIEDRGEDLVVKYVTSRTISKLIRIYCETDDSDFVRTILSIDAGLIPVLSRVREKIETGSRFFKGSLISAKTYKILRNALCL